METPRFHIFGRTHDGAVRHLFTWTRDLQSGLDRAARDAKAFDRAHEYAEFFGDEIPPVTAQIMRENDRHRREIRQMQRQR